MNSFFNKPAIQSFLSVLSLVTICSATSPVSAQNTANLVICENGKSPYKIVLPDKYGEENKYLDYYLEECAKTLRDCVKESTGADIPVVCESDVIDGEPGIFLGATKKALATGIDPKTMKGYECVIKTTGNDLFLVGYDRSGRHVKNAALHHLGTVKAVTLFLKRFLDVEFVMPGPDGIVVPKKIDRLAVPANVDLVHKPKFDFATSRHKEMMYDIGNNFHPAHHYAQHGGHSHSKAIPAEKYGKDHPEYFRLWKGRRVASPERPLYCLSNPDVQETIYQEVLTHIDQDPDFDVVQLAQSDGYIPCQCERCRLLYGVTSPLTPCTREWIQDPVWGEKLWIMHREMAERFLKDRPEKKITLSYYGPTKNVPKELKSLPANALVDMSYYEDQDFDKWRPIDVPSGFYVTLKNWGKFRADGYTPKRDPGYIADQVRRLHANNVKGIYRMGFGELFGMEGPVYYLFGQLLENPDADQNDVLNSYYKLTYGDASEPMKKFFDILHERLKMFRFEREDWNDHELLEGRFPATGKQMRLLRLRFPTNILDELEKRLSLAEKTTTLDEKERKRLQVTRVEFDYLKWLAEVFNKFGAYIEAPSPEGFQALEGTIRNRTAFIDSLSYKGPASKKRIAPVGSIPLFGKSTKSELLHGWGKNSSLKEPFNWDFDYLNKLGVDPGGRSLTVAKTGEETAAESTASGILLDPTLTYQKDTLKNRPTVIRCDYDDQFLNVTFDCENDDDGKDLFSAAFSPESWKNRSLLLMFKGGDETARMVEFKNGVRNDFGSNLKADVEAVKLPDKPGTRVKCRIPLDLFGHGTNPAGETWKANFTRRLKQPSTLAVWKPDLIIDKRARGPEGMGRIVFSGMKTKPEQIDQGSDEATPPILDTKFSNANLEGWVQKGYVKGHGNVDPETKARLLKTMSRDVVEDADDSGNMVAAIINAPIPETLQAALASNTLQNRFFKLIQLSVNDGDVLELTFKTKSTPSLRGKRLALMVSFNGDFAEKPKTINRKFRLGEIWTEHRQEIIPPSGTQGLYIAFIMPTVEGTVLLDDITLKRVH